MNVTRKQPIYTDDSTQWEYVVYVENKRIEITADSFEEAVQKARKIERVNPLEYKPEGWIV